MIASNEDFNFKVLNRETLNTKIKNDIVILRLISIASLLKC